MERIQLLVILELVGLEQVWGFGQRVVSVGQRVVDRMVAECLQLEEEQYWYVDRVLDLAFEGLGFFFGTLANLTVGAWGKGCISPRAAE